MHDAMRITIKRGITYKSWIPKCWLDGVWDGYDGYIAFVTTYVHRGNPLTCSQRLFLF